MDDTITQNAKVVREFTKTFKNEHNVDGIDHLFSKTFQHHFAPPSKPGLAGFKDVGRMMNAAFPDVVVTEQDLIVTADRVVERSSARGTHRGEFMGNAPTGKSIGWTEIHIYRISEGKIAEHWVEFALHQLVMQTSGQA